MTLLDDKNFIIDSEATMIIQIYQFMYYFVHFVDKNYCTVVYLSLDFKRNFEEKYRLYLVCEVIQFFLFILFCEVNQFDKRLI